jgi:perosamine synthetase
VLADTFRALRNQGRCDRDGWLDHSLLGYNYRLSELNCALGLSQMSRLDEILERRKNRALRYLRELRHIPEVVGPSLSSPQTRVCWFAFVVQLKGDFAQAQRDFILDEMAKRGIGCGRYFAPVHRQPLYERFAVAERGDLPFTEHASARALALPFFNSLTDEQIAEVCEALRETIALSRR